MLAVDYTQRIAQLRAAHRARRLTVERFPTVRHTRRVPGQVAIDATAVASALLTALASTRLS
jgi:hypothetical protein